MFLDLFPVAEAKGNFIAAITEDQERNMWGVYDPEQKH